MTEFNAKQFLENVTTQPGVYQMLDADATVLYVGKARNLKKRLLSYFQRALNDTKTIALVEQVRDVKVIITQSENEALLLESNLIKKLKPRYNVLLRDDKSYPYLFLSSHSEFPRLDIHRGPKHAKGQYFGPFPSAGAIRETLTLLQKLFKIRQCSDHFFSLRTRPCLQYFIDRCTAPCVDYIDAANYQNNVKLAVLFLEGKNNQVIDYFVKKMEEAATAMNYEEAAKYRDRIASLRRIQERQYVTTEAGNIDVIAVAAQSGQVCIQVLYIRAGRLIGDKSIFPKVPTGTTPEEALAAFLPQYYLDAARGEVIPSRIIINLKLEEREWIATALSEQLQQKIIILDEVRAQQQQWQRLALLNAKHALASNLASKANFYQRFEALQAALDLANLPQKIECFDVSHTLGEATVASCVVFNTEGPLKKEYHHFQY